MAVSKLMRLLEEGQPTGSLDDHDQGGHVIWLPDTQLLCFIAGSMLLAASLLSFPYLRATFYGTARFSIPSVGGHDADPLVPMLLQDLKRQGLLKPEDQTVFLGNPTSRRWRWISMGRAKVDFIFAYYSFGDSDFSFTDRVLKVGGVIAMRLGKEPFHMPPNYRLVYIQQLGSTVVAMRKIFHSYGNAADSVVAGMGRRLLTLPATKKEGMDGSEDVPLEPPASRRQGKRRKGMNHHLQRDGSLNGYPRLVFVDVGLPKRARSEDWFEKHYPARSEDFEIVRLNVKERGTVEDEGITEWLVRNVKEEEYVVMKAEAEVVDEILREGAIVLVDELFLECSHQWEKGKKGMKKSRRAYWECLALYGKLRDEGVAVHLWWG